MSSELLVGEIREGSLVVDREKSGVCLPKLDPGRYRSHSHSHARGTFLRPAVRSGGSRQSPGVWGCRRVSRQAPVSEAAVYAVIPNGPWEPERERNRTETRRCFLTLDTFLTLLSLRGCTRSDQVTVLRNHCAVGFVTEFSFVLRIVIVMDQDLKKPRTETIIIARLKICPSSFMTKESDQ